MTTTTVYTNVFGSSVSTGWAGYTNVNIIAAANLAAASGQYARIGVKFAPAAFSSGATAKYYIGQKAATGDAVDANALVRLLFNSSGTITGDGSTLDYVSDFVLLNEAYTNTKSYLISSFYTGVTVSLPEDSVSGNASFYNTSGGDDASTVDKTGSNYTASASNSLHIVMMEISDGVVGPVGKLVTTNQAVKRAAYW